MRNAALLLLTQGTACPAHPQGASSLSTGDRSCTPTPDGVCRVWLEAGGLQEGTTLRCRSNQAWFSTDSHFEGLQRGFSGV